MNPQTNSYRGKERTTKIWDGFNHDGSRRWLTKIESGYNSHHIPEENKTQPSTYNFKKPQSKGKTQNIKKILQKGDLVTFPESLPENKSSDTKITSRL